MDANRKRTRDENDGMNGSDNVKRQALMFDFSDTEHSESYEFLEGFRVFDFPWLNEEGVMFDAGEFLEIGDDFVTCSFLDNEIPDTYCCTDVLDQLSNAKTTSASPTSSSYQDLHGENHDHGGDFDQVNDLEPIDNCIWSYVLDQPLDDDMLF